MTGPTRAELYLKLFIKTLGVLGGLMIPVATVWEHEFGPMPDWAFKVFLFGLFVFVINITVFAKEIWPKGPGWPFTW